MDGFGLAQSITLLFLLLTQTLQGLRWTASWALWRDELTTTNVRTLVKLKISGLEWRCIDGSHERGGDPAILLAFEDSVKSFEEILGRLVHILGELFAFLQER